MNGRTGLWRGARIGNIKRTKVIDEPVRGNPRDWPAQLQGEKGYMSGQDLSGRGLSDANLRDTSLQRPSCTGPT